MTEFDILAQDSQKRRGPLIPEIGLMALVAHEWNAPWAAPHHVLARLGQYFHVLWLNPAHEWSDSLLRLRRCRKVEPGRTPGLSVYNPEFWLPRLFRPDFLARFTFEMRLMRARQLLISQGCRRIVLYLWRPEFQSALAAVPYDLSCYHIDDEFSFSPVEVPLNEVEASLIASVDQVFVISPGLLEKKGRINPNTSFVPNGVDYQSYSEPIEEPPDLGSIPRPRIGYAGMIKRQLDWPLLLYLANQHPKWSFVFVGPQSPHAEIQSFLGKLSSRHNVYFLGEKSVRQLAHYPQHFDVCIMPYRADDYTRYIYPLKLHEYLASGRPTVGTHIRSLEKFADVVTLARTPSQWSLAITEALSPLARDPKKRVARQKVAELHDWKYLIHDIASTIVQRLAVVR